MMSEQQFEVFQECEYLEEWSSCPYCIKYNGETVFETLPLGIAKEVCKKLNEQQATIDTYKEAVLTLVGILAENGIIVSGVKDECEKN